MTIPEVLTAHFIDTGARAISSFLAGVSGLISISKISMGKPIVVQALGIYRQSATPLLFLCE